MADSEIANLPEATQVSLDDLFVVSQNATAKKLEGYTFITALATALEAHGGIKRIDTSKAGKVTTVTVVYADGDSKSFQIRDGADGTNGVDGEDGVDGVDGADGASFYFYRNSWTYSRTETVEIAKSTLLPVPSEPFGSGQYRRAITADGLLLSLSDATNPSGDKVNAIVAADLNGAPVYRYNGYWNYAVGTMVQNVDATLFDPVVEFSDPDVVHVGISNDGKILTISHSVRRGTVHVYTMYDLKGSSFYTYLDTWSYPEGQGGAVDTTKIIPSSSLIDADDVVYAMSSDGKLMKLFRNGTTLVGQTIKDLKGPAGPPPTVTTQAIAGGNRVTFTDGDGPHSIDVMNGSGAGDMLAATYDPQGKATDIFEYADDAVEALAEELSVKADESDLSLLYDLTEGSAWEAVADTTEAYSKSIPGGAHAVELESIGGKSVVRNQHGRCDVWRSTKPCLGDINATNLTADGFTRDYSTGNGYSNYWLTSAYYGHVLLLAFDVDLSAAPAYSSQVNFGGSVKGIGQLSEGRNHIAKIGTMGSSHNDIYFYLNGASHSGVADCAAVFTNWRVFDLTQMFGSAVAATITTPEQAYALGCPREYIPYDAGTVVSADVDKVVSVGTDISAELTIPPAIRALPGYGWSAGTVYNEVDYSAKQYIQRVGRIDMGDMPWDVHDAAKNQFSAKLDGSYYETGATAKNIRCAEYTTVLSTNVVDMTIAKSYASDVETNKKIYVEDHRFSSASDFTAHIAGQHLYYQLATPIVTDISDILTDFDTLMDAEGGGVLTFHQSSGTEIAVPNKVEWQKTKSVVTDVQVNGISVVTDGVANVPLATNSNLGVAKGDNARGTNILDTGAVAIYPALDIDITDRSSAYRPIAADKIDYAVKAAMTDGVGAAWTDAEKKAGRQRMSAASEDTISDVWTSKTWNPGELCIYDNALWKCKVANSAAPSEGANWTKTSINSEFSRIEVGTWTPKVYDYNTYKYDLPPATYYKIGNLYIMRIYLADGALDLSGISTMLNIRNLPCGRCIGSAGVYMAGVTDGGAGITIQDTTVGVYFRPNINKDNIPASWHGIFSVTLFGID